MKGLTQLTLISLLLLSISSCNKQEIKTPNTPEEQSDTNSQKQIPTPVASITIFDSSDYSIDFLNEFKASNDDRQIQLRKVNVIINDIDTFHFPKHPKVNDSFKFIGGNFNDHYILLIPINVLNRSY